MTEKIKIDKKDKQGNRLQDLMWDDEKILWYGRPRTWWWEYAYHTPAEWDGNSNVTSKELETKGTFGCSSYGAMFLALFLMIPIVSWISPFLQVHVLPDFIAIPIVLILFGIGWFAISMPLAYIFNKYLFRTDRLEGHILYAVTNFRIFWSFGDDWRYIQLAFLKSVTLSKGGKGDIIEWHGEVPSREKDRYGSQIARISFVGVHEAELLVKLVENTRDAPVPVLDKREESNK